MKKLILLLLIFIYCIGCEKDNSMRYSSSLIGKWSWLRTCGGFAGCLGPKEEHITITLVITADSIYNNYLNDTLRISGRFHTYQSISDDGKDTLNVIKFDSGGTENFSIVHDTLAMGDNIVSSIYRRIK
jgi:hypothetical protein